MTQLLLFDYPTNATASVASPLPAASPVPVTCPSGRRFRTSASPRREAAAKASPATQSPATASHTTQSLGGSLPLYEPAQGELHRIGDLAQVVLARYEIVHRRRAARLRRARSAPGIASQSRV
ncbi:hypothetical protein [Candidatus Laterigemmans baculatus]|uniref:hypothetical protein n=1 Tax=Candidatus Laterigemmans baculatus TaxID=2770505 RepID=UPI0013DBB5FC|nr:hypothetical protein [Candidatus Laterigemmans baculatus]